MIIFALWIPFEPLRKLLGKWNDRLTSSFRSATQNVESFNRNYTPPSLSPLTVLVVLNDSFDCFSSPFDCFTASRTPIEFLRNMPVARWRRAAVKMTIICIVRAFKLVELTCVKYPLVDFVRGTNRGRWKDADIDKSAADTSRIRFKTDEGEKEKNMRKGKICAVKQIKFCYFFTPIFRTPYKWEMCENISPKLSNPECRVSCRNNHCVQERNSCVRTKNWL